ncbi:MAG: hypothetical protein HFI77_12685 [Lachnospiraceae bacterium]|nr:hypothetical protein [Lachnospiraceae bacterium]
MQMKEKLKSVFEKVGIYLTDEEFEQELEIDSFQFVSVIIALEEEFLIHISNDFEDYSSLITFNDFYKLVAEYFDDVVRIE